MRRGRGDSDDVGVGAVREQYVQFSAFILDGGGGLSAVNWASWRYALNVSAGESQIYEIGRGFDFAFTE